MMTFSLDRCDYSAWTSEVWPCLTREYAIAHIEALIAEGAIREESKVAITEDSFDAHWDSWAVGQFLFDLESESDDKRCFWMLLDDDGQPMPVRVLGLVRKSPGRNMALLIGAGADVV